MANSNKYPAPSYHFKVEFQESRLEFGFKEVSGIKLGIKYEQEKRQKGDPVSQHKVFEEFEPSKVTLKKGIVKGENIYKNIVDSIFKIDSQMVPNSQKIKPQMVYITLMDELGEQVMMILLEDAYAVGWEISSFDAMSKELAMETIELEYRKIRIV